MSYKHTALVCDSLRNAVKKAFPSTICILGLTRYLLLFNTLI